MIKQKIISLINRCPDFQYHFFFCLGVIKQLKYLFLTREISSNAKQPFLFIVGSGRSGNTLLRRLLMEYGDIYVPPESYVLSHEVISHLNACALSWDDRVDLTLAKIEFYPEFLTFEIDTLREFSIRAKNFAKDKQQVGTLIVELYRWIAEKKGYTPTWLGDKTPINTLRLGLIRKLIPQAVYIYIERDGVDVCHSFVQAGIFNNMTDAANRWKESRAAWLAFKKNIPKESYIELKYETLLDDHEENIKSILNFFNIPARNQDNSIVREMGDVVLRPHHANVMQPPNKNSIGKGREKIGQQDREILKKIINNELEKAGYETL